MEVTMPVELHSMILKCHECCSGLLVDVMQDDIDCWKRLEVRWAVLMGSEQ